MYIDIYDCLYYNNKEFIAELCKGSTADSDSVCLGSNPSRAAIFNILIFAIIKCVY